MARTDAWKDYKTTVTARQVIVSEVPGFSDWEFAVARDDTGVSVVRPPGRRISVDEWRAIPIGSILAAAANATGEARADLVADGLVIELKNDGVDYTSSSNIAFWNALLRTYRVAAAAGVAPREVVAKVWNVNPQTAERWFRKMRTGDAPVALGSLAEERRAAKQARS